MKTMFLASGIIIGFFLIAGHAFAQMPDFVPGQILSADDLNQIADQVDTNTAALRGSLTIAVDCNASETIGQALAQARPGDTIRVTGTCNEMVTITTDRLTLDGQGSTIIDGGGGFPANSTTRGVITITSAQGVVITGLTVQNGPDGISALSGSAVTLTDVTAKNNADTGIQVSYNSTATFNGTIVSQNNGDDGIAISGNSSSRILGVTIINSIDNGDDGIEVSSNSSIRCNGTIVSQNNDDDGIVVANVSSFVAVNSAVDSAENGNDGIIVTRNSYFGIGGENGATTVRVEGNDDDGLVVSSHSNFLISSSTPSSFRSQNNARFGFQVSTISVASCGNGTVQLSNNGDQDFVVSSNSVASSACGVTGALSASAASDTLSHPESFEDDAENE